MGHKSNTEREEIIIKHLPLVKSIVARAARRIPPSVTRGELTSDGNLGLIDAVDRYDPTKGACLISYAKYRIRGAILDGLKGLDRRSGPMREKIRKIKEARTIVESRVYRPAEEWEVAEEMGISLERYFGIRFNIYALGLLSLNDFIKDKDNDTNGRTFEQRQRRIVSSDDPVQNAMTNQTKSYLIAAIKKLPKKQRQVVFLYYYGGLTQKEIGNILDLNNSRICQIHGEALTALRAQIIKSFQDY